MQRWNDDFACEKLYKNKCFYPVSQMDKLSDPTKIDSTASIFHAIREFSRSLPDLRTIYLKETCSEFWASIFNLNRIYGLSKHHTFNSSSLFSSLPNINLSCEFTDNGNKSKDCFSSTVSEMGKFSRWKLFENWLLVQFRMRNLDGIILKNLIKTLRSNQQLMQDREVHLNELQKNYEELLIKYAEAENTIERLKLGFSLPVREKTPKNMHIKCIERPKYAGSSNFSCFREENNGSNAKSSALDIQKAFESKCSNTKNITWLSSLHCDGHFLPLKSEVDSLKMNPSEIIFEPNNTKELGRHAMNNSLVEEEHPVLHQQDVVTERKVFSGTKVEGSTNYRTSHTEKCYRGCLIPEPKNHHCTKLIQEPLLIELDNKHIGCSNYYQFCNAFPNMQNYNSSGGEVEIVCDIGNTNNLCCDNTECCHNYKARRHIDDNMRNLHLEMLAADPLLGLHSRENHSTVCDNNWPQKISCPQRNASLDNEKKDKEKEFMCRDHISIQKCNSEKIEKTAFNSLKSAMKNNHWLFKNADKNFDFECNREKETITQGTTQSTFSKDYNKFCGPRFQPKNFFGESSNQDEDYLFAVEENCTEEQPNVYLKNTGNEHSLESVHIEVPLVTGECTTSGGAISSKLQRSSANAETMGEDEEGMSLFADFSISLESASSISCDSSSAIKTYKMYSEANRLFHLMTSVTKAENLAAEMKKKSEYLKSYLAAQLESITT